MKTYVITEEDIERLRCNLDSGGDEVYWYISQLDNWEETLEHISDVKLPYSGLKKQQPILLDIPEDFYTNRAKYFVMVELEKPKEDDNIK